MPLPAVLLVAGAVVVQASGAVSTVAGIVTGIDSTITAAIDLKRVAPQAWAIINPVKVTIQPVPYVVVHKQKVVRKQQ